MKTKILGVLAVSALLGTALATTSFAQDRARGGAEAPRGEAAAAARGEAAVAARDGARGRGVTAQPARFIERHDTDADGRVSEMEFVDDRMQNIDEHFERRDANGDGLISADEHAAPRGVAPGGRAPRGDREGRDERPARPEIDREALVACVRQTIADYDARLDDELEDAFDRVDTNGDGKLSLAEVSTAVEARAHDLFARIDDNGDGYITEDEVAAHFAAQLNVRRVVKACIDKQLGG